MLHKNTVHYRIRKAEEILGRPVQESRLDVELALSACRWLGSAALPPPDSVPRFQTFKSSREPAERNTTIPCMQVLGKPEGAIDPERKANV